MSHRRAITRIETVLLIGMIATILAVVGGGIMKLQQMHHRKLTEDRLKALTLALHDCQGVHKRLPPATGPFADIREGSPLARHATLHVHLLPFLEADALHDEIIRTQGQNLLGDEKPAVDEFHSYNDPSLGNGAGVSCFAANLRVFTNAGFQSDEFKAIDPSEWGFPDCNASIPRTFRDGMSNTMVFTTIYSTCNPGQRTLFFSSAKDTPSPFFGMYAPEFAASSANQRGQIFQVRPDTRDCNPSWTPHSLFNDSILVGLGDGSIRMIGTNMEVEKWARMQHPADKRRAPREWGP